MPTLSDDEIIQALYLGVLQREPDSSGLENYRNRLKQGATLGELITEFVSSDEHRKKIFVNGEAVAMKDVFMTGWHRNDTGELLDGFPIAPDDVVVDVGCGDGGMLSFCAKFASKVVGIDVDPARIENTKTRLQKKVAKASYEMMEVDGGILPLPDNFADKIICTEVLEHVDDPKLVLDQMHRIGKKDALYLISVPDAIHERARKQTSPASAFRKPNHVRIFERAEFAGLVESAGLKVRQHLLEGFYQSFLTVVSPKCSPDDTGRIQVLDYWAKTWLELMKLPEGKTCKTALDAAMPKSQIIIAQKS